MKHTILPLLATALVLVAGCKTPVVFSTHTSLGLDVSGTAQLPNKVSFSYHRFEGAIVPRKTNGESHSVYGGLDADLKFFGGHVIKQTFATGKAAMLATDAGTNGLGKTSGNSSRAALVFATATTFGLHLTAGEQQMSPNLLLGYRRSEAALVPVPDPAQEVRSVYAHLLINSSADSVGSPITTNFSALRGVRIKQSFATGRAAEALATNKEVRAHLAAAAGVQSVSDFQKKATLENRIATKLRGLPTDRQKALFTWADRTFPAKSGGQLAARDAGHFQNSFLPDLNPEEQSAVLDKIHQLEQEIP